MNDIQAILKLANDPYGVNSVAEIVAALEYKPEDDNDETQQQKDDDLQDEANYDPNEQEMDRLAQ